MARVNKVMPPAPPAAKPQPAKQPPAKGGRETQTVKPSEVGRVPATIAGRGGPPAKAVKGKAALAALDGLFQPIMLSEVPDELPAGGGTGTYVGFAHHASSQYDGLTRAGIAEPDPYLAIEGQFVKLDPFKFFLLDGYYCRANFDENYNLTGATRDVTDRDYNEYCLTLLALFLPEPVQVGDATLSIVPARCEFLRAVAKMGKEAIEAVREAAKPEFATASPDHKAAAQCTLVAARVTHVGYTKMPTSKQSGYKYIAGDVASAPSSVGDIVAFAEAAQTEAFQRLLDEAKTEIGRRKADVEKLMA